MVEVSDIGKDKRICAACDSDTTYRDPQGVARWSNHDGSWLCHRCYNKYIAHPIWNHIKNPIYNKKWNHINNKRRQSYKDRIVYLKNDPRKGICQLCGAIRGKDCQLTSMHHIHYHDDDPTRDTIELCNPCHRKTHIHARGIWNIFIAKRQASKTS